MASPVRSGAQSRELSTKQVPSPRLSPTFSSLLSHAFGFPLRRHGPFPVYFFARTEAEIIPDSQLKSTVPRMLLTHIII